MVVLRLGLAQVGVQPFYQVQQLANALPSPLHILQVRHVEVLQNLIDRIPDGLFAAHA